MCKFSAITDEDYERVLRIIEAIVRGFDRNDEIEMERGFHKQGIRLDLNLIESLATPAKGADST